MGGIFPERGMSFNIFMDSVASEYVFKNWTGEYTMDLINQITEIVTNTENI